jgi:hypothetical protein
MPFFSKVYTFIVFVFPVSQKRKFENFLKKKICLKKLFGRPGESGFVNAKCAFSKKAAVQSKIFRVSISLMTSPGFNSKIYQKQFLLPFQQRFKYLKLFKVTTDYWYSNNT